MLFRPLYSSVILHVVLTFIPPVSRGGHRVSAVLSQRLEGTNSVHTHLDNPVYCKAWPRSTPPPPPPAPAVTETTNYVQRFFVSSRQVVGPSRRVCRSHTKKHVT